MKNRKVAAEIATPGCWAIYVPASRSDRFSSLCGDGTVSTVVLNSSGQQASRAVSAKLFDPDKDPLFMQGEEDGDTYHFVSYLGNISSIAIGGKTARLIGKWSLLTEAADNGWRPSGYQPLAVHPGTGRLYVTMHSNGYDGSHTNPAEEIWGFDMNSKKRVVRMPGYDSIALEPSNDGKRLYAIDIMKAELVVIDLRPTPTVHVKTQIGAVPIQIEAY
jgi:methylamine dehydrogenase heavy chain